MRFLVNPEEEDARGWAVQHWNIVWKVPQLKRQKGKSLVVFGKHLEKRQKRKRKGRIVRGRKTKGRYRIFLL
jgi:hypothetical protein